ncbi:hypothetical protein V502_01765 [Pseudogymnoascus sp. VKM F-4520 (FW-2644)]|nr:hypothetical protein V502_01765 [Pseudogymnoascus sp. VKM F-4520 (FW-2644)]
MICLSLLLLAFLLLAQEAANRPSRMSQKNAVAVGKAIYFLTNDQANGVVAIPIGADGTLSQGTVTGTGGCGSVALNSDNQPATPDALVSQSALTLVGDHIFTVNAGEPVAIPGEFPNTVAASIKNNLVERTWSHGQAAPFELDQSTPPVGPTNTVSQTFFSADESLLFTTVKGDPPTNKTGFLSAFAVEQVQAADGATVMTLAGVDTRSTPKGTAVLFGSQVIRGTSNMFVTDAAFGAAILSVDPVTVEATTIAKVEVDGQVATCWVAISPATGTVFVTDTGLNRLVEMNIQDASILSELDLSANGDLGLIDLRAAGNFVYALSPGNGTTEAAVTVIDVSGSSGSATMIQHFGLSCLAGQNAQREWRFLRNGYISHCVGG